MAIDTLDATGRLTGGGTLADSATGEQQSASFGGTLLPGVAAEYTYGTGDAQARRWYLARRTLAAGAYDDLNLTSGLAALGATQVFAALKRVFVGVASPDGTRRLRVGPQGRTGAAQLWFQAATANFWVETYTHLWMERPYTGWAVTASTADVFCVHNPTAGPVDYVIWLLGT